MTSPSGRGALGIPFPLTDSEIENSADRSGNPAFDAHTENELQPCPECSIDRSRVPLSCAVACERVTCFLVSERRAPILGCPGLRIVVASTVSCNGIVMVESWVLERRSAHENEFRKCLTDWLISDQKATPNTVNACLLLLQESHLLSLPLPPRVVLPAVPGPRNFRFLFRRQVASLLGWSDRREEGEIHGFSDAINTFVREIWWPDGGAEALHRSGHCNRQSW